MSKKRLGKRERTARKRRISIRKHGHHVIIACCSKCSERSTWRFNPAKANKLGFNPKLVCGRCKANVEESSTRALEAMS